MSRGAARNVALLQVEEARRLELRQVLVRLLVEIREQVDEAWDLFPGREGYDSDALLEVINGDLGKGMIARQRRIKEALTAVSLIAPAGPLRMSLLDLEHAALRDWSDKVIGPFTDKPQPSDQDRINSAFFHLEACYSAISAVEQEGALFLAELPRDKRRRFNPF